jgi:hypothetical protein
MYARDIDDATTLLHRLRHLQWENLGLAALVLGLAVAATKIYAPLAIPLFVGGVVVGSVGMRALWSRADLLDQLTGERDAYSIPEVVTHASRAATMARRRCVAASIRTALCLPAPASRAWVRAMADELEGLASELDDERLALDPACAIDCARLVDELQDDRPVEPGLRVQDMRSQVLRIRAGFRAER